MADKVLNVPYFTQPTSNTCQSTCLKMYAHYLANKLAMSSPVHGLTIEEIWKEINTGNERPAKGRNAYRNMVWWLGKYFPHYEFKTRKTRDTDEAMAYAVNRLEAGFPLMVSTNHRRTAGHIILVVGYRNFEKNQCRNVDFVCHDPYGKFDPSLGSRIYGKRRYSRGMSLAEGGEVGPGKGVTYDHQGIRRIRSDKHSNGTYFLMAATGPSV